MSNTASPNRRLQTDGYEIDSGETMLLHDIIIYRWFRMKRGAVIRKLQRPSFGKSLVIALTKMYDTFTKGIVESLPFLSLSFLS